MRDEYLRQHLEEARPPVPKPSLGAYDPATRGGPGVEALLANEERMARRQAIRRCRSQLTA